MICNSPEVSNFNCLLLKLNQTVMLRCVCVCARPRALENCLQVASKLHYWDGILQPRHWGVVNALPSTRALGKSWLLITMWEFYMLLCCHNFWLPFPLGRPWKTSRWLRSPPLSTYESRMENCKFNPSLKGLLKRWCRWGELNPHLLLPKGRAEGTSHQLQVPFHDQLRNEMNLFRLYESNYVGFWRFLRSSQ